MQEGMEKQGKTKIQEQVAAQKPEETMWSSIIHLMQIILLQFRFVGYCMILLAVVLVPLMNMVQLYMEKSGDYDPWYLHIGGGGASMELIAMMIFMLAGSYNILSKNEISMYPGTVISRYGGTVLAFHIMILMSVLASIASYLIQGILLAVATHVWDDMILANAFSLSYLWHGAVRYLGLLLVIYALGVFWFVLMERFNTILVSLFTIFLAAGLIVLKKMWHLTGVLQTIGDFFQGRGYSFAALIAVLFGIWAVLMFLSLCLAGTVKVWKEADKKRMGVTVALSYLALIGMFWICFEGGYEYSLDPYIFQQESNQQMEVVVDASALETKDIDLLSTYRMSVKYQANPRYSTTSKSDVFASISCSASEAKQYGLSFDESKLDQDHLILLLGTRNLTFAGKDLGEDVLKAYQQSTILEKDPMDVEYQEDHSLDEFDPECTYQTEISYQPIILLNGLYGDLGMYMDDTTLNWKGGFWRDFNSVTESLLRVVIYPDEWDQEMAQE